MSTPMQAIREKCLDCSNYQPKEVRNCPIDSCAIFQFRFGRNPNRQGIGGKNLRTSKKIELSS